MDVWENWDKAECWIYNIIIISKEEKIDAYPFVAHNVWFIKCIFLWSLVC